MNTLETPKYPVGDKSGCIGIHCKQCGTIMYAKKELVIEIFNNQCPICKSDETWFILNESQLEDQPDGDGF